MVFNMRKILFLLVGALFFSHYVFSQNLAVCGNSVDLSAEVENYTDFSWFCDDAAGVFSDANSLNTTFSLTTPFDEQGYLVANFYYNAIVGGDVVSDTVHVEFLERPVVNAGPDFTVCGLDFHLNAISSHTEGDNITGVWTCLGIGTATFDDATSAYTTGYYSGYGSATFRWTESNHPHVNTESDIACSDYDDAIITFYEVPSAALSMNVADTVACGLSFEFLRAENPEGGMSGYWYEENTSTQFGMGGMGIFNPITDVTVSSYGRHDFYWIVYAGPEENPRLCVDTAGPWTINFVRQPIAEISTSAGPFVAPDAHVIFYNTTDYQDMENVVCEWHFGDGTNEDNCSESVEHVYAEADCYEPYLVVMSSNAPQCSSTARLENCVSVTTSIADFNVKDIDISPNPATNFLNITSSEVISDIEIVNVMGQVVYRTEVNSDNAVCDVEDLKAGVYIIRIYGTSTASVVCQRKFIKE